MALYVCFDDSYTDPTYSSADGVWVVESEVDSTEQNPCATDGERHWRHVPLLFNEESDARLFAEMMGWDVVVDSNGNITFATNIKVEAT